MTTVMSPRLGLEHSSRPGGDLVMSTSIASKPILNTLTLPRGERCPTVLARFDALAPGEALQVITDHEPRPLLRHLRRERQGLFEWTPLETGPELWRTELVRRAANLGELRCVTEALAWDHDRLDALLARVFEERARSSYETARHLWHGFEFGLRRHIRFEEQVLFPELEERTGMPRGAGPTAVMRAEHRDIEMLLEGIRGTVGVPGSAAETLRAELVRVLGEHNEKEEQVLYPGTDNLLTREESDALVARIQEA
jgi:uncharacterized protein (DUF2249 family)/hemerythrin superfamily protein